MEMENRLQTVERERDVYRLLARRWQSRLQTLMRQKKRGNASAEGEDDGEVLLTGRELFGLSDMFLQGFDSDEDDDDDAEEDAQSAQDEDDHMEEDQHMEEAEAESFDDAEYNFEETGEDEEEEETWEEASSQPMDTESTSMSPGSSKALALRPQIRAVSISSDDL